MSIESQLVPLFDRVLGKRVENTAERTPGGIIIPETSKEPKMEMDVIAVGDGRQLDSGEIVPMLVKPGQRVLVGKWAGTDLEVDGKSYMILRQEEILAIIHQP